MPASLPARSFFAACLALCLFAPPPSEAAPIPVETAFRKATYFNAQISPSGRYVALITTSNDHRNVAVIDLETRKAELATSLRESDALRAFWLNDNRLVVTFGDIEVESGNAPRVGGVVAIDRDGGNSRDIPRLFQRPGGVAVLRGIPGTDDIFVTARDRDVEQADLYRVNTRTGTKQLLSYETPGQVSDWVLDFDNVPRAIVSNDLDRDRSAWYARKDASSPWVLGGEAKLGTLQVQPLAFSPDGKTLYLRSRVDRDRAAIVEYDVAAGRMGAPIIQHPERDVTGGFLLNLRERRLLGFAYEDDRPSVAWFDTDYARIQKSIDLALKDTVNNIARARDGERWIVVSFSDRHPGSVYLLDGKTFKMEKLVDFQPGVKAEEMSPMRWVRYKARDGRVIPAMLTLPRDAAGRKVPLVVDIHGGPHVPATRWGYDAAVQFFASRGYAVLQPQFRGTDGFGWQHLSSGYRQWGEAMQDDLVDGVRWTVAEGLVDPARVCYYGASYGGYAAMWGAIRDREVIRCSVAFVGVSSIDYLFDIVKTDVARVTQKSSNARVQLGDPDRDRARWKRVNPVDNADKVGVPILLAYGMEDQRVPLQHGTDFRSALDRHDKPYEWVTYKGEGHGFNKSENVFDFYNRVDRFLKRHLGAP
jgi:dipeptidyl aminopeptidase/acylaminoacyl peptidase